MLRSGWTCAVDTPVSFGLSRLWLITFRCFTGDPAFLHIFIFGFILLYCHLRLKWNALLLKNPCHFIPLPNEGAATEGLINEVNMSMYCAPTVSAAVRSVVRWSKDPIRLVNQNRASDLTAVSVIAGLRPHQSHVAICILSDRTWRPHRQRKGICEHIPGLAGKY